MLKLKDFVELQEDGDGGSVGGNPVITNSVSGVIASLGIQNPKLSNQAEPGVEKGKKKKILTFKQMFQRKLPE